jgi:predicted RNA polymerase sigma factor
MGTYVCRLPTLPERLDALLAVIYLIFTKDTVTSGIR